MSITRAQVETVLLARCGKKMAIAGLDGTTHDGTNPDLTDPISASLFEMGYLSDLGTVSDANLTSIEGNRVNEFLDRAERRCLENISGNLDLVNISLGPRREDLGQLVEQVENAIARLERKISQRYGDSQLIGDTLRMDFQEKDIE
jgi:hypothetical protein